MMLCWQQCMMTSVCNGPRSQEYLDHSWHLRKGIRVEWICEGVNSSKNEGQMLYNSVQEQSCVQVLITVLVSDLSLVFDGKLTPPTICLH